MERDNHKTEKAEKLESSASTITTLRVEDTPPLIEKDDGSFMIFGHWIKLEKERMNPDDGVYSVKARPFFFEPIKIDKQEENDTRLLFKGGSERKMIDFLGLWSSKERKETTNMNLNVDQERHKYDETWIDLTLRLAPPVNKKRKIVAGPSSSTSDLKIVLPVNVVPPNPHQLVLFDQDPWKIKKVLKRSDVNGSSRLLIGTDMVTSHILPHVRQNNPNFDEARGTEVVVLDIDTGSQHTLTFKRWKSNSFVFVGGWTSDFVKRRNLKESDEIGLKWDDANSRLEFTLLHRNH